MLVFLKFGLSVCLHVTFFLDKNDFHSFTMRPYKDELHSKSTMINLVECNFQNVLGQGIPSTVTNDAAAVRNIFNVFVIMAAFHLQ